MGINLFSESYFGKHIPIIQKCVEQLSINDRLDGYTGKAQSLLVDIHIIIQIDLTMEICNCFQSHTTFHRIVFKWVETW